MCCFIPSSCSHSCSKLQNEALRAWGCSTWRENVHLPSLSRAAFILRACVVSAGPGVFGFCSEITEEHNLFSCFSLVYWPYTSGSDGKGEIHGSRNDRYSHNLEWIWDQKETSMGCPRGRLLLCWWHSSQGKCFSFVFSSVFLSTDFLQTVTFLFLNEIL